MSRQSGFSLLEMMVVLAVLSIVLVGAFGVLDFGNRTYSQGSVKQLTQMQAQRVVDKIAEDFSNAAAWQMFALTLDANGQPTAATRLTKFYIQRKLTGGYSSGTTRVPFGPWTGAPYNAATTAVAFQRIVGATCLPDTSGYGAYLILDFEPAQAVGTNWAATGDINANATPKADHQGGRMDDDPNRAFIYYRTRIQNRRVLVERVRGTQNTSSSTETITTDGTNTATGTSATGLYAGAPFVQLVGDLGPAAAPTGLLPVGVPQGYVTIDAVDNSNTTSGAGYIKIHVNAKGVVRKGAGTETIIGDVETVVSLPCGLPPY